MIPRPFALIGFSVALTLLFLNLFEGVMVAVLIAAVGCLAVCLCARGFTYKAKTTVVLLSVIIACALFGINEKYIFGEAVFLSGKNADIRATIVSLPEKGSTGWFYTIRAEYINGNETKQKIELFCNELIEAEPYDEIEFTGDIYVSDSAVNNKADGVFLNCFRHDTISVFTSESTSPGYFLLKAKEYVSQRLYMLMPNEEAAVAVGMLTGDKSGFDSDTKEHFRKAGLSHILAVSGLHMSIVIMGLYKFLTFLTRRHNIAVGAVCMAASVVYAGVSGFSMSAVRSSIMICFLLLGRMVSRQADSFNSMGAAALLIVLVNPYAVLDWSFMLSFSATAGIIGFSPKVNAVVGAVRSKIGFRFPGAVAGALLSTALISLVATVACFPVTVFAIKELSLSFLPSNLLSVAVVPVALVSALISVIPMGALSAVPSAVCSLTCRFLKFVAEKMAELPYSDISVDSHYIRLSLIAVGVIIFLSYILVRDKKRFYIVCASTVAFAVAVNVALGLYLSVGKVEIYCEKGNVVVSDGESAAALCTSVDALSCVSAALESLKADSVVLIYPRYDSTVDFDSAVNFTGRYRVDCVYSVTENAFASCCDKFVIAQDVDIDFGLVKLDCRMGNNGGCMIASESGNTYYAFSKYSPVRQADFLICGKYYDKADKNSYTAVLSYWDGIDVYKNSGETVKCDYYVNLSYNARGQYTVEGE